MQGCFTPVSNEADGKCDLNLETHKQYSNKTSSMSLESIAILSTMLSFVGGNYSRVSELISHTVLHICCSCNFLLNVWYPTLKCHYMPFYQAYPLVFCAFIPFLRETTRSQSILQLCPFRKVWQT